MHIDAFATQKPKEQLLPFSYETKSLQPHEVLVKISHCGLCHSDLHLIDNDWAITEYPFVPGHEIVGHVVEKGNHVPLANNTRVGIGWQRSSCLSCTECLSGHDNLCMKSEATCVKHFGGFANYIVADGRFVHELPDALDSVHAAPLLCAGATVFSPFILANIQGFHTVGIVGIGGLGHLALQFANAFGCRVLAFSHTPKKEQEAYALGASEFLLINQTQPSPTNGCDLLICTSHKELDWNHLFPFLKPTGKICLLGRSKPEIHFDSGIIISRQLSFFGSPIASRAILRTMLTFAVRHHIAPKVELYPLEQVNDAIQKLRKGEMRYRAVLAMGSA